MGGKALQNAIQKTEEKQGDANAYRHLPGGSQLPQRDGSP